ncbi:MAG: motility associated factor glycosyltransferase family protein [Bacillota bacterium]
MYAKSYEIIKSRDGRQVLKITEKDRAIIMGSKYNTNRDIEIFINSLGNIGSEDIIIIFGLGCGEHLRELADKMGENGKAIVFEPDENIINVFYKLETAKLFIDDKRFKICHFSQANSVETILSKIIFDYELSSIAYSHYANYDYVYGEEFLNFIGQFKDYIRKLHISKNTNIAFSKIWFDAFLRNIKVMSKGIPVDELKNKFQNKPAIIVSAGPSLRKNIHLLKKAQDKFIIITGGRNLKALIDIGVTPHFVCIIDPVDKTYRLVEECLDCNAPLLFYEGTNPDVVEKYKGPKIYFTANDFAGDFIRKTEIHLNYGGSVAHSCFGLAIHLGCDRIIFVGQDFAYTDDKIHAENAVVENEKNDIASTEGYVYVDGIHENKVKTSITFDLFRKTMEDLIRSFSGRSYINSTEGGANIRGTIVMPLDDALKIYSSNEAVNINICKQIPEDGYSNVIEKTKYVLEKLKRIKKDCKKGIELSDNLLNVFYNGSKIEIKKINRKLDRIDSKIKNTFESAAFINFILYPVTQMVLGFKEFKVNKDDPEDVKGKKIIIKANKMYVEMSMLLDEAITIMENNMSEI